MLPLLERIVGQLFGGGPRHPESETLLRALDAGLSAHDADAHALRAGDEHFRVLAETIPAAIFIYQGERFRYVNAAASELTGYTREELLSVRFWELWVTEFGTSAENSASVVDPNRDQSQDGVLFDNLERDWHIEALGVQRAAGTMQKIFGFTFATPEGGNLPNSGVAGANPWDYGRCRTADLASAR